MTTYEKSFKEEAVRLSDEMGVKLAASQLGIPYWTLADWRAARKARGKKELIYRISAYRLTMEEVRTLVFRYVFVYYNRIRVYTANPGGWPPEIRRGMYFEQAA